MTTADDLDNRTPEVSVVVGVRNGAAGIRASLSSVLSQEGVRLELIVVDDGSTDGTLPILRALASQDARVRVFHQEGQGLTHALIRGCSVARGEFIARHDADDVSLPQRLAKQLMLLRTETHLSLVSCWTLAKGPGDEVLFEVRRPGDAKAASDRLRNHRQGPGHHGSVVFRRSHYEQVGGYRPEFYFAQDSDLWLRLIEVGDIAYVPETLYEFQVSPSSISSRHRAIQHELGEIGHSCREARRDRRPESDLLRRAAALRPGSVPSAAPDLLAGEYFIGRCLVQRRDPRARRYLWNVAMRRPWKLGAIAGLCQTLFTRPNLPRAL